MTGYADQAHFNNYDPSAFGWPRNSDLVPFTFGGVNFGQVARAAAPVFHALLSELVPLIPGGLHAGSCWGYAPNDDLPDGSWSFHHYGTAIDVNWNVNHMGNNIPDAHGQYAIPRAEATAIAHKYGCEWGGNWLGGFHDNMHFEVHLSPSAAAGVVLTRPQPADPLEWIMSLPGAPAGLTYQQLCADIGAQVMRTTVPLSAPDKPASLGTVLAVNHSRTHFFGQTLTALSAAVVKVVKKVGA